MCARACTCTAPYTLNKRHRYALGLLLLEVLIWTAIGASAESKSQREMQQDKKKVTIKSLRDAKKAVKSKKFASNAGGSAGGAGGVARCDQQFGSALAWGVQWAHLVLQLDALSGSLVRGQVPQ